MEYFTESAENKMMILYAINKAGRPVPAGGFVNVMLGLKLMNYFDLQENIHELSADGCIKACSVDGRSSYMITVKGKNMLGYFKDRIPEGIRKRLGNEIGSACDEAYACSCIIADYREIDVDMFEVELIIRERSADLMDLKLLVGKKTEAMRICSAFKDDPQEIYKEITGSFIK